MATRGPKRTDVRQRLETYRVIDSNTGCWLWTKSLWHGGYGRISIGPKTQKVSRVSYEIYCGPIPQGMVVMHKCDNVLCFNPEHLAVGTQSDNVLDAVAKGRWHRLGIQPICRNGHEKPYAGECLICKKIADRRAYLRLKNKRQRRDKHKQIKGAEKHEG